MTKSLEELISKTLESHEEEFANDKSCKLAVSDYQIQYEKVRSYLNEDTAFEILDGLDNASARLSGIEKHYFYKAGILEGIRLLAALESSNIKDKYDLLGLLHEEKVGSQY